MVTKVPVVLPALLLVVAFACKQSNNYDKVLPQKADTAAQNHQNALIEANKQLVLKDEKIIEEHVRANGLNLQKSQTGLWYQIIKKGTGKKVEEGDKVSIAYTLALLDGTVCHTDRESGPKTFKAGQGGVERGLEEGLLLLHKGDSACFILPPHLGHGLTGDGNKIPARSILIYNVKLLDVKKNE
ncbi:MAG: peptidylprolyl isomerase [Bacteroidales bacterium]|nr:peptidylprolyl isomerase [Bacteroidales bacterium]